MSLSGTLKYTSLVDYGTTMPIINTNGSFSGSLTKILESTLYIYTYTYTYTEKNSKLDGLSFASFVLNTTSCIIIQFDNIPLSRNGQQFKFNGIFDITSPTLGNPTILSNTSFSGIFQNAANFDQPLTNWDTTNVTTMTNMFNNAAKFNQSINNLNTTNVTDMSGMFAGTSAFNQLLILNTTKVKTMASMFTNAKVFNESLDNLDTSNVINMTSMFSGTILFNQPLNINTSKVESMSSMFSYAKVFNQPLTNFDTALVNTMREMFRETGAFNQSLSFNTSNVTTMENMFHTASVFNGELNFTDVSKVTNMAAMFYDAKAFNQPINFNSLKLTNVNGMFLGASKFNQVCNLITSSVTNMANMFKNASAFNQSIISFNTEKVTSFDSMFSSAISFNQLVDNLNTNNITNMTYMFHNAIVFNQPLTVFNTAKVTNMAYMFSSAKSFNQPLSHFDTSKVTTMAHMFNSTPFNYPLTNFDTSNVTTMASMFANTTAFNQSINHFNTSKLTTVANIFDGAKKYNQPIISITTGKVTTFTGMLANASVFQQTMGNLNYSSATTLSISGIITTVINYTNFLIDCNNTAVLRNVNINAGLLKYLPSASTSRANLIANLGWRFTDGGMINSIIPNAPIDLIITLDKQSIILNWTQLSDYNANGGSDIVSYKIEYKLESEQNWISTTSDNSTPSYTINNVSYNSNYSIRIAATNSAGNSLYLTSSITTLSTVPNLPINLLGIGSNQQIALTWTEPSNNGGSPITSYSIQYKLIDDANFTTINTFSTNTNYLLSNLINRFTYTIQIAAINSNGTSIYTDSIDFFLSTLSNSPTNLSGNYKNQQVELTWTEPSDNGGSPILSYSIQYKLASDSNFITINTFNTNTNYILSDLQIGSLYNIQIAAINNNGISTYTDIIDFIPLTISNEPSNLFVTTSGYREISLQWNEPSNNGGAIITSYVIEYKLVDELNFTIINTLNILTSYTITNLKNGSTYDIRIAATNSVGNSLYLTSSIATLKTISEQPTNLSGTSGYQQILLTWNEPLDNGGSAITSYNIQYKFINDSNYTSIDTLNTETNYILSNLQHGLAYNIQVSATNNIGNSPYVSTLLNTLTTTPSLIQNFLVTQIENTNNLFITWAQPIDNGGLPILYYIVEYRYSTNDDWLIIDSQNTTLNLIFYPNEMGNCVFKIVPINSNGLGESYTSSTYSVACYHEDTQILCYNTLLRKEMYIQINQIDFMHHYVKVYPSNHYKKVKFIGYRYYNEDNNNVDENNQWHNIFYDIPSPFSTPLTISGYHSLLVDKLNNEVICQYKKYDLPIRQIYDKFFLIVGLTNNYKKTTKIVNKYYHIVLENKNPNQNYCIWANGLLSESQCECDFIKNHFINICCHSHKVDKRKKSSTKLTKLNNKCINTKNNISTTDYLQLFQIY